MVFLIIALIIGFFIAIPLGILLVGGVAVGQAQAKRDAKKILANSTEGNPRKFKRVMNILSKTPNDLEATDLWKRLNELSASF